MDFTTKAIKSIGAIVAVAFTATGCSKGNFATQAAQIALVGCSAQVTGDPWVPNVAGASASNHDSSVVVTKSVQTGSGLITGFAQGADSSREISFSIDMTEDLGPSGSLSLVAETIGYPPALTGGAYPMLVYLSDGTNDFINLARSGVSGDCTQSGYFTASGGDNSSCAVSWPSAYGTRDHWLDHQFSQSGYTSVNTFPTCNWAGGAGSSSTNPGCAFNSTFFPGPAQLRSGVTYTAKYVLLATSYPSRSSDIAGIKLTVIKKRSPRVTVGGAMDLNVILVGSKNVAASRTPVGQRNLDTLFTAVANFYAQPTVNVKIGAIRVYEWGCPEGGEIFSDVDLDDPYADNAVGAMFETGSKIVQSDSEGKALNIFLVSTISSSLSTSTMHIVGLSGGITGPMINGTGTSGLVFSSFNKLDEFNPNCPSAPCPLSTQDEAFEEMAETIAHELGHYLGLKHPSERDGTSHDRVLDTPICTKTQSIGGGNYIYVDSCRQDLNPDPMTGLKCSDVCTVYDKTAGTFCPDALECQFNHIMWWASKNFKTGVGTGDGNHFSTQSGVILNYNPYIQ